MSGGAHSPAVNWRRTDDGVELYDESDPDAWLHMAVEPGAPADERPFSVCPECGVVSAQRTVPGRHMVCGECGAEFETDTSGTEAGRSVGGDGSRAVDGDGTRAADDT